MKLDRFLYLVVATLFWALSIPIAIVSLLDLLSVGFGGPTIFFWANLAFFVLIVALIKKALR